MTKVSFFSKRSSETVPKGPPPVTVPEPPAHCAIRAKGQGAGLCVDLRGNNHDTQDISAPYLSVSQARMFSNLHQTPSFGSSWLDDGEAPIVYLFHRGPKAHGTMRIFLLAHERESQLALPHCICVSVTQATSPFL